MPFRRRERSGSVREGSALTRAISRSSAVIRSDPEELGSAEDVGEAAGGLREGVRRAKGAEQGGWGEGDGALVGNVGSEKGRGDRWSKRLEAEGLADDETSEGTTAGVAMVPHPPWLVGAPNFKDGGGVVQWGSDEGIRGPEESSSLVSNRGCGGVGGPASLGTPKGNWGLVGSGGGHFALYV